MHICLKHEEWRFINRHCSLFWGLLPSSLLRLRFVAFEAGKTKLSSMVWSLCILTKVECMSFCNTEAFHAVSSNAAPFLLIDTVSIWWLASIRVKLYTSSLFSRFPPPSPVFIYLHTYLHVFLQVLAFDPSLTRPHTRMGVVWSGSAVCWSWHFIAVQRLHR